MSRAEANQVTPPELLVLFDVDGTLVDSKGAGRRALTRMFHQKFGVANAWKGYKFTGRTDPKIIQDGFLTWLHRYPSAEEMAECEACYLEFLDEELNALSGGVVVLPGVIEILDKLAALGVPLGLATGNMFEGARLKLSAAKLWDRFQFGGYGSDHIDRGRLTAIGVERGRRICKRSVADDRVFVVGDSPLDVVAAKAAGVSSLAVMTGWSTREEIAAEGPTFLVENLADTEAILNLLFSHRP